LPLLPLLLLGVGGALVYFGLPGFQRRSSEVPFPYYQMGWASPPTALGMIVFGGWLIYMGCEALR
jgi:hypothetical protein